MRLRSFCFGVALTSAGSLGLSLLFTRIFSVTMYYHFAFLLISLALLGIAVSGVAVYLLPGVFTEERRPWQAGLFAAAIAPLTAVALSVAVQNPISVDLRGENLDRLLKLYAATALPFLASGFAISLAIASAKQHIGRVYAFDLAGAGLGCVLIVPLIAHLGAPSAVLVAGAVTAAGGALLGFSSTSRSAFRGLTIVVGSLVAIAVLAFALWRGPSAFRIAQGTKFLNESAVEYEKWNAFSRVTVSPGEPDHKWIHIDADAATRMYAGSVASGGYEAPRRFSEARVAGLVYALRREGPALIIGPGGGPDVVSALRAQVPRIIGVEVNPIIANDIMRDRYVSFNGDLYRNTRIEIAVDDGRSYVRRSSDSFSSIQATLVDTWAASAAGAFTLSENNLYTAEAFGDYLDHLKANGVLSMTRWYGNPPIEFLRLMGLGRAALLARSVPESEHHRYFLVAADSRMATMLLKREPFLEEEVKALLGESSQSQLRVLYDPLAGAGDRLLQQYFSTPLDALYTALPFDVSPVSDNRPFFFYSLKGKDFLGLLGTLSGMERNNLGLALLQVLLLLSLGLTLLLIVLPLAVFRRDALRGWSPGKTSVLIYFVCLGLGFILVELGLMQRFILFLGHPIYALAVVLASLLTSSGVGSALSKWLAARYGLRGGVRRSAALLTAVLLLYAVGLGPLFGALLGLPIVMRIAIAVGLVAPVGLLMGMFLPLGVRAANAHGAGLVAWGWGLNGATSVVGSALSIAVSMHFGFTATLLLGLSCYWVAAAVFGPGLHHPDIGERTVKEP